MIIPVPSWLPPPFKRSAFNGTADDYLEALYEIFKADFIHRYHKFEGLPLFLKRHPFTHQKEEDFWHILCGKGKFDISNLDLLRCERLPWVLPIIQRADQGLDGVVRWENNVNNDSRICLMSENYPQSQIVVIARRTNKNVLFTSHPVGKKDFPKYMKRHEEYLKTKAAS